MNRLILGLQLLGLQALCSCALNPATLPVADARRIFSEMTSCEDVAVQEFDPAYIDEPLGHFEYFEASGCGEAVRFACPAQGSTTECVPFRTHELPAQNNLAVVKVLTRYQVATPLGTRESIRIGNADLVRPGSPQAWLIPITPEPQRWTLRSHRLRRDWRAQNHRHRSCYGNVCTTRHWTTWHAEERLGHTCGVDASFTPEPNGVYRLLLDYRSDTTCTLTCAQEITVAGQTQLVACRGFEYGRAGLEQAPAPLR